jgi:hypothetical protein
MQDLTCKEYIQFIDSLKLSSSIKEQLLRKVKQNGLLVNEKLVFNCLNRGSNEFINHAFGLLKGNINHLFKYSKWKNGFMEATLACFKNLYGSKKNEYLMSIYEVLKDSKELNLSLPANKNFFLQIFHIAVNIDAKVEEDSVVRVMYDMFKNKEKIDVELLKEMFALYIEKITTDVKYQKRINDIKAWASTQDFTNLLTKYKNIRNYFDESNEEKVFTASSKKYDLKVIAKENKTKLSILLQNFNALNNFISDKLKTNENIQDFIIRDEKIFYKVLIIYDKRDFVIDAAIKMHEAFFGMIRGSESIENELMASLWEKLMMKGDLENSFAQSEQDSSKALVPRKVNKL